MSRGTAAASERRAFVFLNHDEALTVDALAERIFPTDELGPGASQSHVTEYIDRALGGAECNRQGIYRSSLQQLDQAAAARHGKVFVECAAAEQDELIQAMIDGRVEWSASPSSNAFFEIVRAHVLEGMFSDPAHGGNHDFAGWKLLGYWGPVPTYSHEEQQLDAKISRPRFYSAADYPLERDGEKS
jgi:gluconate 2-dehydrogenase gamma chain